MALAPEFRSPFQYYFDARGNLRDGIRCSRSRKRAGGGRPTSIVPAQGLRFWGLGLLPAFMVGLALRWVGIRAQVLTDDELHTVGAVLAMPLGARLASRMPAQAFDRVILALLAVLAVKMLVEAVL